MLDIAGFLIASVLYLLMYIAVYFLVVTFHTAGHFIAAKLVGVGVTEVAVGYGKVVCSTTRGGTRYSLRLIPIWC